MVGTFHAYSTKPMPNYIASVARRAADAQPPLGPDRRLRGGGLDGERWFGGEYTIIPNGVDVEAPPSG